MRPFVEICNGDEAVEVSSAFYLSAEHRYRGNELLLGLTLYSAAGDEAKAELRLEPYDGNAYWVFVWEEGDALVVVGAEGVALLRLRTLDTFALLLFELDECERSDVPMLVKHGNMLAIVTETRVSLFADKLYRWTWSTRVLFRDWCQIQERPAFVDGVLKLELRAKDRDVRVDIDVVHGIAGLTP